MDVLISRLHQCEYLCSSLRGHLDDAGYTEGGSAHSKLAMIDAAVTEAADALEAAREDAANMATDAMLLRQDAERYRWLRDEAARYKGDDPAGGLVVSVTYNPRRADGAGFTGILKTPRDDDFDAAIDAEREARNG